MDGDDKGKARKERRGPNRSFILFLERSMKEAREEFTRRKIRGLKRQKEIQEARC